jgi:hypothetical protein
MLKTFVLIGIFLGTFQGFLGFVMLLELIKNGYNIFKYYYLFWRFYTDYWELTKTKITIHQRRTNTIILIFQVSALILSIVFLLLVFLWIA